MYTDGDNYPNLKKLPSDLENALEYLSNNEVLIAAFGEKNVTSYLKLKEQELKDFNSKETFSKKRANYCLGKNKYFRLLAYKT